MRKNMRDEISVNWIIKNTGNWNFRDPDDISLCTKPIAVVFLQGDEYVFKHEDIFEIIKAYHEADKLSIEMIRCGLAGNVKSFEKPLLNKIADLIVELKNQDNKTRNSPYFKNGQKELRI